jgi:hypothetical protein
MAIVVTIEFTHPAGKNLIAVRDGWILGCLGSESVTHGDEIRFVLYSPS